MVDETKRVGNELISGTVLVMGNLAQSTEDERNESAEHRGTAGGLISFYIPADPRFCRF